MVDASITVSVQDYLAHLRDQGVIPCFGVVFGSRARGTENTWSDIDVVVVSPVFDGIFPRELINRLWRVAARTDNRIEPIPCGERQWKEDAVSPILEFARREGARVNVD